MIDFQQLANPRVRRLQPYQPGKPIETVAREYGVSDIIKLASNESPWGASPQAITAATNILQNIEFYPDGDAHQLKLTLAKHLCIDSNRLTLGNGSDEVLSMIVRAFVKPGQDIIISEYAFSTFAIIANANHANPVIVKSKHWGHDLTAMAQAVTDNTGLIFIANPNNPTGTYNTQQELQELMAAIKPHVLVVVDEAYYEYCNTMPSYPQTITLQQHYPNMITTRTFSKAYALAGLRLGYSISHPEVASIVNRLRLPFNINSCAQAAAVAALQDQTHIEQVVRITQTNKDSFYHMLQQLGLSYIPSSANFVTVDFGDAAQTICEQLLQHGIIVRPLLPYQMPQHLRITIGTEQQMERLKKTLIKLLPQH